MQQGKTDLYRQVVYVFRQEDSADFVAAARSSNWQESLRKAILEAFLENQKGMIL